MRLRAWLLLFGASGFGWFCSAAQLRIWPVDSLVKVFPEDEPAAHPESGTPVLAVRGEVVNLQFAVRAERDLEITVAVRQPRGPKGELPVQVRWVDYVPVRAHPPKCPPEELVGRVPGLYPDPLRESFPMRLAAGKTYALWLTVRVPAEAAPGLYHGTFQIRAGSRRLANLPLRIRVSPVRLPPQRLWITNWFNWSGQHLRRHYGVEEFTDAYWQLLENIGRVMADHGQNVILTPVVRLAQPRWEAGALQFDFTRLDRWVETFDRAGIRGLIEGSHLLGRRGGYYAPVSVRIWVEPAPGQDEPRMEELDPLDPRALNFMEAFLSALYAHLRQRGWISRYVQHVLDEPHGEEPAVYERYAQLVRKHMPGVRTIDAINLADDYPFFETLLDIWVPILGRFDDRLERIREHQRRGGEVWFYTCISPQGAYMNRFINQPLLKVRLLHWLNARYGLAGYLHWGGNYWTDKPFEDVEAIINQGRTLLPAGDNAIVYPDPERLSVLSSIRLEAMRDGIEDHALLSLLQDHDPKLAGSFLKEVVGSFTDYVRDPLAFGRIRNRLVEALERLGQPSGTAYR